MVGLNFKDTEEAKQFAELIPEKLSTSSCSTSNSGDSDTQKIHHQEASQLTLEHHPNSSSDHTESKESPNSSSSNKFKLFKNLKIGKSPETSNKKLAKDKISVAYDFAHIHHLEYNEDKRNFRYDFKDSGSKYNIFKTRKDIFSGENLEKLLEAAGVTQGGEL